jgi:hypothetical protein
MLRLLEEVRAVRAAHLPALAFELVRGLVVRHRRREGDREHHLVEVPRPAAR